MNNVAQIVMIMLNKNDNVDDNTENNVLHAVDDNDGEDL